MKEWFYFGSGFTLGPFSSEGDAKLAMDKALKGLSVDAVPALDGKVIAAGVLYACRPDFDNMVSSVLLIKRSLDEENYAGYWSIPGGGVDGAETPEQTAMRESMEEIGCTPPEGMEMYHDSVLERGDHHYTFLSWADEQFTPVLNAEHTEFGWFEMGQLPKPIHPGVKTVLAKLMKADVVDQLIVGDSVKGFKFMAADKQMIGPFGSHALARVAIDLSRGAQIKGLAYDKQTMRFKDPDGRMHLISTHISKACVSPYMGNEIAGFEELGLAPDKVYHLLRDPEELAKAAPTFNGLPIMIEHTETDADSHVEKSSMVVGSTGSTAVFNAPYLDNSIAVWPQEAIDLIESDEQKELSCGYYYRADMTPGNYEGVPYDGVMRDIVGNHLALVKEGRAGPDVLVMDGKLKPTEEKAHMAAPVKLSRVATGLKGALTIALMPKMAKDKKLNLDAVLQKVTLKSLMGKDGKIKAGVIKALGKAAWDAAVEAGMVPEAAETAKAGPDDVMLKMLEHIVGEANEVATAAEKAESVAGGDPEVDPAADPDAVPGEGADDEPGATGKAAPAMAGKQKEMFDALCASGMGEDDATAFVSKYGGSPAETAEDEDDEDAMAGGGATDEGADMPKNAITKKAMDAAIKVAVDAKSKEVEQTTINRLRAISAAEKECEPYVGKMASMAHDSVGGVYRTALKTLGVDVKDVQDEKALGHILRAQPTMASRNRVADTTDRNELAFDSSGHAELEKKYPHAKRIGMA